MWPPLTFDLCVGQRGEEWDVTGFWKLTEQFRGSRRVTLDGGRKTGVEDRGSSTRGKDGGCNLEDGDGIFPLEPPWLTACSLVAFMKAPIIHGWEKRGGLRAPIACREQGEGKMAALCRSPVSLSAGVHLKTPVFVLLSQVETCSLDLLVNSDFSVEDKRGKYRKEWKDGAAEKEMKQRIEGEQFNGSAEEGKRGLSMRCCE